MSYSLPFIIKIALYPKSELNKVKSVYLERNDWGCRGFLDSLKADSFLSRPSFYVLLH